MKIFLDTNILLDFIIQQQRPNHDASSRILYFAKDNPDLVVYCSVQSISDAAYYFTKKGITDSDRFLLPMKSLLSFLRPRRVSEQDLYDSLRGLFDDFEDELLLRSAIEADCAYFITGDQRIIDTQPFNSIKAIHPAEFLALAARNKD